MSEWLEQIFSFIHPDSYTGDCKHDTLLCCYIGKSAGLCMQVAWWNPTKKAKGHVQAFCGKTFFHGYYDGSRPKMEERPADRGESPDKIMSWKEYMAFFN